MKLSPQSVIVVLLGILMPAQAAVAAPLDDIVASVQRAVVEGDVDALATCRANLDTVADADAGLVAYTRAYVDWRIGTQTGGKDGQKTLKLAERELDELLDEAPDDAETLALLGSVYGARITGALKGMSLGPKAGRALDRAVELAPDNPRVLLQQGINKFRAPKSFGGGADQALDWLRRAEERFADEPAGAPWPSWGRVDVFIWKGQVLADLGEIEPARAAYTQALEVEPGHVWVVEELLPALDEDE